MSASHYGRLERLERAMDEDSGGVFVVLVPSGKSEEEALRDAMAEAGLTKRPRCPIFLTPVEAEL